MPLTDLLVGTTANDGFGETLRSGGQKINTNYTFTVTTDTAQDISGVKNFQSETQTRDINIRVASSGTNYVGRPDRMFIEFERPTASGGIISFHTTPSTLGSLAERMRIDSSGNVGIGTTSIGEKLVVQGNVLLGNQNSTADGHVEIAGQGTGSVRITRTGAGATSSGMAFSTTFATLQERMRIDSSGKVGIGTTSPISEALVTAVDNTTPRISVRGTRTIDDAATEVFDISGGGGCIVTVHHRQNGNAAAFTSKVYAVCGRSAQGYTIAELATKDGGAGRSFTIAQDGSNARLIVTNTSGGNCFLDFSVVGM